MKVCLVYVGIVRSAPDVGRGGGCVP